MPANKLTTFVACLTLLMTSCFEQNYRDPAYIVDQELSDSHEGSTDTEDLASFSGSEGDFLKNFEANPIANNEDDSETASLVELWKRDNTRLEGDVHRALYRTEGKLSRFIESLADSDKSKELKLKHISEEDEGTRR